MSCAGFLGSCVGNCTDDSAFEDACDTCPPDTCAGFLGSCLGNCTEDSAFEDACMKSCETPASAYILWGLLIVAVLWFCYRREKKKKGQYGQGQPVQAYPVNPQTQVYQENIPEYLGTIVPEQKYSYDKLTREDQRKLSKVFAGEEEFITTHDGVIIDKNLVIKGRIRSALNQPTVF
jgi:hypothetical protein